MKEKMGGGYEWLILLKDFISRKNYEKIYDGLLKTKKNTMDWLVFFTDVSFVMREGKAECNSACLKAFCRGNREYNYVEIY